MTLEIIIFISAIVFGLFWYWRESLNNGIYRFFNKILYSEKLQMKSTNRKGFVFQQNPIFRLAYIVIFFVIIGLVLQFLTPIRIFSNYYGVSAFASSIFGTLLGTYIANFLVSTSDIVDEKTEDIEAFVKDTIDDGKEFLDGLKQGDDNLKIEDTQKEVLEPPKKSEKSARDRLKDKGYL